MFYLIIYGDHGRPPDPAYELMTWFNSSPLLLLYLLGMVLSVDLPWVLLGIAYRQHSLWRHFGIFLPATLMIGPLFVAHFLLIGFSICAHAYYVLLIAVLGRGISFYLFFVRTINPKKKPLRPGLRVPFYVTGIVNV